MTSPHSEERAVATVAPAALETYGTSGLVDRFSMIADEIAPLIKARSWAVNMGRSDHVKIEGWTCLGAIMGIGPSTKSVTPIIDDNGRTVGYEAHVAVCRAVDGAEIGSAINECRFSEVIKRKDDGEIVKRWVQPDGSVNHHAMKSMAQTRAASKALASWCRPIVEMAGYSGTPYEEMSPNAYDEDAQPKAQERRQAQEPGPDDAALPQDDVGEGRPGEPYTPEGEWAKWLDDPVPFKKGEFAGKTWRHMSQGSPGGARERSLQWIADEFDVDAKPKSAYQRALRCLAFIRGETF